MRFILTPVGSQGDVPPYVGVGRRLKARGHEVVVLTAGPFRELVQSAGLDFVETLSAEEFHELTKDPDLWHPRRGLALIIGMTADNLVRGYELLEEVYRPGDVLVGHLLSAAARLFQEKHDVPAATIQLAPSGIRSIDQVPPLTPGVDISSWPRPLKRLFWWLCDRFMIDPHLVPALNRLRAELGLQPAYRPFKGWLNSPRLVIAMFPDWFGGSPPDWPEQVVEVGFPLYDEADLHDADDALEAFLGAHQSSGGPIALTPGSANRHGKEFFAAGLAAADKLGRAALCLTGFPEQLPHPLPDFAFHARYAPFSRVFPRCCAVAHHGGIGTLGQGLAAGIPQLIMPLGFDQPDNAARLQRLGVGDWLVPARFQAVAVAEKLEGLIASVDVRQACDRYRDALAGGDAIGKACDLLEEMGPPNAR